MHTVSCRTLGHFAPSPPAKNLLGCSYVRLPEQPPGVAALNLILSAASVMNAKTDGAYRPPGMGETPWSYLNYTFLVLCLEEVQK